jgi:Polyketide cyclase / dehydrase and lipid transport
MSEHHVSVEVHAPIEQVYNLFTHFNDFPKFMSFIKEVTYYDEQRSHWVAQVGGNQEWDAVNENWIPQQQVGWRSTSGLENSGLVKFQTLGGERTSVDVYVSYVPPAGVLGEVVDKLGFDSHFDHVLEDDLNRFAAMVEEAPRGALDPMQSHYLFTNDSAYARASVTERQEAAMAQDPMMQPAALKQRENVIEQESEQQAKFIEATHSEDERVAHEQHNAIEQQRTQLSRQAELDREMAGQRQTEASTPVRESEPDPVYGTLGGRNASIYSTTFGDQDGRNERFPGHTEDPMTSRNPQPTEQNGTTTSVADITTESPWLNTLRGASSEPKSDDQPESTTQPSERR